MATEAQTALVTGAGRGIGRGIALELARVGFDVAVNDIDRATAEKTCDDIAAVGRTGVPVLADVSRALDRERLVDETEQRLGPIALLVNNAGVAPRVRADILEAGEESFEHVMGVNLKGPYFLTQLVAGRMIQWKAEGRICRPKIVFITSISAFTASVNRGDYCLSKAALSMAVKLYAVRLAGEGIGVYEVQPGVIDTEMTAAAKAKYDRLIHEEGLLPIARWGEPRDVGQAIAAIAEDRFSYSTGLCVQVDGGFHLRTL